MLRPGRFRHRLLETPFLKQHSTELTGALAPFIGMYRRGALENFEIAAIYILVFSFFRRPGDFLGGPHGKFSFSCTSSGITSDEVISVLRQHLPVSLRDKKILSRLESPQSFMKTFTALSWRSIPLAVPRALRAWQSGEYPLELLTMVPSPEYVLQMQAQGKRCVSMLIRREEIENLVEEGRDVLGFLVHDLIHADHFFSDPVRAQAQILFSQKLQEVFYLPQIQRLAQVDEVFKSEFNYLMSDMNSVPLHLLKTLKAVLLGHFKRAREEVFSTPLCSSKEQEFLELLQVSLSPWNLDEVSWQAALRLNTPQARGVEDSLLLDAALNKLS